MTRCVVWILLMSCLGCVPGQVPGASEAPSVADGSTPCTAAIRGAACSWRGSYDHVRERHCEVVCPLDGKSLYARDFIATCDDGRLEAACAATVEADSCRYFVDDRGGYVVTSDLGTLVGSDRNDRCAPSSIHTVVLDRRYRVVTMYPGRP